MISGIKKIGFDADDTLWVNETYFRETERQFFDLISPYIDKDKDLAEKELYSTEMKNMSLYGYGVKAFILSVVETAIRITEGKMPIKVIDDIIRLGKEQLSHPVELLDGVEATLNSLVGRYELILVTKGDLLDQERKLFDSGLGPLFHHVEIMSDKTESNYIQLLKHIGVLPEEFLMIGNSLRSDVLPPLNIGSYAVHIPFHTTWLHEHIETPVVHPNFYIADSLWDIISLLP